MQNKLSEVRHYLQTLVIQGGPDIGDYEKFTCVLADLVASKSVGLISDEELHVLLQELGDAMTPQTVQGLAFTKPHGYAGDYEIIDRIYQHWVSPSPKLAKWDYYFHAQAAPKAVRARKKYFHDWLAAKEKANEEDCFRLLDIASGSARDVFEYFSKTPATKVRVDCVEQDANAIAYAENLCAPFADRIIFHRFNALRFRPKQPAQLVWSAGLFDYLEEKVFVALLRRLWLSVISGGELVIGNFSPANPTRAYMEIFGEWFLNHRTSEDLVLLAQKAGIPSKSLHVACETEGVNLFLHARKD